MNRVVKLLLFVLPKHLCAEINLKEEGVEEALEQLAMLVGAEHVDDITEKFKVTVLRPSLMHESPLSLGHTACSFVKVHGERRRRL